ncbi:MAG: rhomboid family intramembrane serine protease [Planctomycetota bacterium]|jgi:membrane associated rhomboid family serine protease
MGDRDYLHSSYDDGGHRTAPFWGTNRGTKACVIGLAGIHLVLAVISRAAPDAYDAIYRALALSPEGLLSGKIWQLVTYALMHSVGDLWHILINCLVFWWFGQMVEGRLTTKRFLYFCLGASVFGGLIFVAWGLVTGVASSVIGASGVTMALLVLGACWYPNVQILLFFILRMKLWVAAAILVGLDLLGALRSSSSEVAYAAHLGGAAWGWLFYRYGNRIEGVFKKIDRMADKADRKKQRKREEQNSDLRAEVDRILDKVNKEGMHALTDDERSFLKKASKKLGS